MTSLTGIFITALLLCHLVVFPRLVTSQLLRSNTDVAEEVTIEAKQQEKIGDVYQLRGDVLITFRNFVMRGDQVTYDSSSGVVTANGHLVFDGGAHDEHIEADHGDYNVRTEFGKFYEVVGTTGARFGGQRVLLTSPTPFAFSAKVVEKQGPNRFVIHHGYVTSCRPNDPKWSFDTETVIIDLGDSAKLYHSTLRFGRVPVFYFPYSRLPVEQLTRQSGFLIPNVGQSSTKGFILGDSFYWAINRSADATLGAEYYSQRGWAQHGTLRARPSESSVIQARYFGVIDHSSQAQGGEEVQLTADGLLPYNFRGAADLDYLSSYVFRQAFSETFTQAVNSEVKSVAFTSKPLGSGYIFNAFASRYQNFQSTERGDLITILHAPSFDFNGIEKQLARSPFYWSFDGTVEGVSRREPDFVTDNLVGRFNIFPRVALPLHLGAWDIEPEVAVHDTYYTQARIPNAAVGTPGSEGVTRKAFQSAVNIRPPAMSRIFDRKWFGHTIKHVIEPSVTYRYVTGIDNFNRIIRFDAQDILSNTNEFEYSVVNRVFTKGEAPSSDCSQDIDEGDEVSAIPLPATTAGNGSGQLMTRVISPCGQFVGSREVITWELAQKYFMDRDFGGALVPGVRNVFTTTAELTGVAFLTEPRLFSPLVSRLRMSTSRKTELEWHFDYDTKKGVINASTVLATIREGNIFFGGSHAYLRAPGEIDVSTPVPAPIVFDQVRWLVGYGNPNRRGLNAAANLGFDIHSGFLQYSAVQTSYNWDCCGVSFEYRRLALGSVRNENQFRFALSLTNIGTFGTLRRQERLF